MHRYLVFLMLSTPMLVAAQAVVSISPDQCVWRAGDDLAWASPDMNESGWRPYSDWQINPDESKVWVRCRAVAPNVAAEPTGIQVRLFAAFELYVNGEKAGSAGNVRNGNFNIDVVRTFPLQQSLPSDRKSVVALRITYKMLRALPSGPLPPLQIELGSEHVLQDERLSALIQQSSGQLMNAICFSIIGVIGFVLLGLWLYDRGRRDLELLTILCLALPFIYLNYFFAAAMLRYPVRVYLLLWAVAALVANLSRLLAFFALANRRVPLIYWIFVSIGTFGYLAAIFGQCLPLQMELHVEAVRVRWLDPISLVSRAFESTAPFVAFWPIWKLERRIRALGILCMAWGATMVVFFLDLLANSDWIGIPSFRRWGGVVANAEAISTLAVITALLALLFRDQRQTTEERAILAGEMQAAREIQRMLTSGILEAAPGVDIQVAFHPMREVGGDFFLCPVLPDGRQRLLLGDVSGKGSAAAMTAALLMGGAQARPDDSPGKLLAHLNEVMRESHVSGFATCICADLAADGTLTLANAGHLAPYSRGEEIQTPANLPLGLGDPNGAYEESRRKLEAGESLTFLSDGVVEARDSQGRLLGFERTRAISTESAEAIAAEALKFGQEDDITVLTLLWEPAPVGAGEVQATAAPA